MTDGNPTAERAYQLPTARQVVGRGLQLAFDASRDIRRASLYVGLLLLLVAAPLVILLAVDLPTLLAIPWNDIRAVMSDELQRTILQVIVPLYVLGLLAIVGLVSASIDGQLIVIALLAARVAGSPLSVRQALRRARQTFWRFSAAAFVVGLLSQTITIVAFMMVGGLGRQGSVGASVLVVLLSTIITAPFGYFASGIVIGDVGALTSLSRSISLLRARPRLALVVAVFAFAAGALQTFGLGAAADVADKIAAAVHPTFGPEGPSPLLTVPLGALAIVAFGSLAVTVNAIVVAPQVVAFVGLTHFTGGVEAARAPTRLTGEASMPGSTTEPATTGPATTDMTAEPAATGSHWAAPPQAESTSPRWVSLPMLGLVGLSAIIVAVALLGGGTPPT